MDYEKKYKEAFERARKLYNDAKANEYKSDMEDYESIFPELAESEDERIRKEIISALKFANNDGVYDKHLAWLEKQKNSDKAIDAVERIDEYINIHTQNAHDMKNSNPSKQYCLGVDDTLSDISLILQCVYGEKQKYDRMKPIYDARESFESALEKAWNDYHNGYENVDKLEDDYVECAHAKGFREGYLFGLEKQKEPLPIPDKFSGLKSLMLQYLQSAANRKDDSEIESDTDLWGRKILDYVWKYSDEQKEQKSAEWDELQAEFRSINEAFEDGKKEVVAYPKKYGLCKPAEWSEEDEACIRNLESIIYYDKKLPNDTRVILGEFLSNLRPQPKKELSIEKAIQWLDDNFYFLDNSSGRGRDCEITTHDFDSLEEMYDSFLKAVIVDSEPSWKPSEVCYGPKGDPDPAGVWKPSEEQMKALLNAEGFLRAGLQHDSAKTIAELYEQLKKLM